MPVYLRSTLGFRVLCVELGRPRRNCVGVFIWTKKARPESRPGHKHLLIETLFFVAKWRNDEAQARDHEQAKDNC